MSKVLIDPENACNLPVEDQMKTVAIKKKNRPRKIHTLSSHVNESVVYGGDTRRAPWANAVDTITTFLL